MDTQHQERVERAQRRHRRMQRKLIPLVDSQTNPLFIIAPARSGSTFLLRLINCFEGITVWGEHGGFVGPLAASYASITNPRHLRSIRGSRKFLRSVIGKEPVLKSRAERPVDTIEWLNPYVPEQVTDAYRLLFLSLFATAIPTDLRWGFKEVRYELQELTFLAQLFPQSQFLFLIRDPVRVIKGQIDDLTKGRNTLTLARTRKLLRLYRSALTFCRNIGDERFQVIEYESLCAHPERMLQQLSRFLGTGLRQAAAEAILSETRARGLGTPPSNAGADQIAASLENFACERQVSLDRQLGEELAQCYVALVQMARSVPGFICGSGDPARASIRSTLHYGAVVPATANDAVRSAASSPIR